ncbi:MAG: hypothetical protein EOM20_12325 [Spartobacteria bacterium]|nr:hypothetical protein [Spartobacteria bacterium]
MNKERNGMDFWKIKVGTGLIVACFLLRTSTAQVFDKPLEPIPLAEEQVAVQLPDSIALSAPDAYEYLVTVMDRYHTDFHIYDDYCSPGNHFPERARVGATGQEHNIPPMNEACMSQPHSGNHCIECTFVAEKGNWGGWFFMNGAFLDEWDAPRPNWGTENAPGYYLEGATKLTFWARGAQGGEKVRFSCLGLGWKSHAPSPSAPFSDSANRKSTGYITLQKEWTRYTIDVSGLDLNNVLLGFAWETKSTINRHKDICFYLDDISFDLPRLEMPRFLTSYQTQADDTFFDQRMCNTAYLYDNALALLALLAGADIARAQLIADAILYAQRNDRFYRDGRLRNAYQGGDLAAPPGYWADGRSFTTRLPGYWDVRAAAWVEDGTSVGTHAGNMAWAGLALISFYEKAGGSDYLDGAIRIAEWLEANCRDTRGCGGYCAGYEGWEPTPQKLSYKSTEHNIDLYALFQRLFLITGESIWRERADYARHFFLAMWDPADGKFWTGTHEDGVTISRDVIPVDAQAWALMALREAHVPYRKCLEYSEDNLRIGHGYDFNQDGDGIWYEGTAQMAVAFDLAGHTQRRNDIMGLLYSAQDLHTGGIPAAQQDGLTTGFYTNGDVPWVYYKRLHVGATAWMLLAEKQVNPFWMGAPATTLYAACNTAK